MSILSFNHLEGPLPITKQYLLKKTMSFLYINNPKYSAIEHPIECPPKIYLIPSVFISIILSISLINMGVILSK